MDVQELHPFAVSGDHVFVWCQGDDRYRGARPHAEVAAATVAAADSARRALDEAGWYRDSQRLLETAYLRNGTPRGGSGFGGTAAAWRAHRGHLSQAVDRAGRRGPPPAAPVGGQDLGRQRPGLDRPPVGGCWPAATSPSPTGPGTPTGCSGASASRCTAAPPPPSATAGPTRPRPGSSSLAEARTSAGRGMARLALAGDPEAGPGP